MLRFIRLAQIVFGLGGLLVLTGIGAASVSANGGVGNGTPKSCTQKAFNAKFSGGGTITFNCGKNPVTITLTALHTVNKNTTIDGGNKITLAASNVQLFQVAATKSVTLKNITLANGRATNGGAIENLGTLTLKGVKFNANHATVNGGAIDNQGTLNITNSQFNSNQANAGGAIAVEPGTSATLTNVTFTQNNASDGGGLFVARHNEQVGSATLTSSTFSKNTATYGAGAENDGTLNAYKSIFDRNGAGSDGGGIWNLFGTLTLEDTTVSRNNAGTTGGGISSYDESSHVTLRRTTLEYNEAGTLGGGMYNEGTATLENVTIGENKADGDGGGYYNALGISSFNFSTVADNTGTIAYGIYRVGGTVNLKNTLLANNSLYNCRGMMTSQGYNLSTSDCDGLTMITDKNKTQEGLTGLTLYSGYTDTYQLYGNNPPALDAASEIGVPATDQRGSSRFEGSAPDIGSVEQCQTPVRKATKPVPANGATVKAGRISLSWTPNGCSLYYQVFVVAGSKKGPPVDESQDLPLPNYKTKKLPKGTYYWRVDSRNDDNFSEATSGWFSFKIQ